MSGILSLLRFNNSDFISDDNVGYFLGGNRLIIDEMEYVERGGRGMEVWFGPLTGEYDSIGRNKLVLRS